MLKAVIFDMDGVIADTEPGYKITTDEFLREQGIVTDDDYQDQFVGVTSTKMWNQIIQDFGLPFSADYCIEAIEDKRKQLEEREGLHPLPGVIALIERLYKNGYSLAVASSSSLDEIKRIMEHFQIAHYFHSFVSGEQCEHSKPAPDVFLKAAKCLRVAPSECLVIEDSKNGVKAARSAGMKVIGFENPMFGNWKLEEATKAVNHFDQMTIEMIEKMYS